MALGNLDHPLRSIHGEVIKHSGIIFRVKNAHDEAGQVIHEGKQEIYKVVHPRNFTKTPPQNEEKQHFDLWTEACKRAALESQPDHPRYPYWRERWRAQLHAPDPECEPNKKTGRKQCYYQFDCFVRVAILWELRKQVNA